MTRSSLRGLASAFLLAGIAPAWIGADGDDPGPAIITNRVVVAGLTEKDDAVLLKTTDEKRPAMLKSPDQYEPIGFVLSITATFPQSLQPSTTEEEEDSQNTFSLLLFTPPEGPRSCRCDPRRLRPT